MAFLELDGLHIFVTGAAGGIGTAIVDEFLAQGCKVSAHDLKPSKHATHSRLFTLQGDIRSEDSIAQGIQAAYDHFGPINVLIPNAGITDESNAYPIWSMPVDLWDKTYAVNVRGTFLTIKHFLAAADAAQKANGGAELHNLAIVLTGSECGKFGQAGHSEYASGKSALQYGLVMSVKNEIVRLNGRARINAVAPGWVDTPLIEGRLDDPREMWKESQATVPLRKIAKPEDVARAAAFLASHRVAGHISGQCLSIDGGMEGRLIWAEEEVLKLPASKAAESSTSTIPTKINKPKIPPIKALISVDFDAVSGWLGTGKSPENVLADYSTGFFSAQVGVPRLLKLFKRLGIHDKVTWFMPGHSIESFPEQSQAIASSGAEVALHGYCHESSLQLTETQERDVIEHCIKVASKLSGTKPVGYRAPLYQLRESTLALLQEHGFAYDSSLTAHDSMPYYLPAKQPMPPIKAPEYRPDQKASEWMHPLPRELTHPTTSGDLLEFPCNWYGEDMTPLQFWPHTPNSAGYVDVNVVQDMWKRRFEFIKREVVEEVEAGDATATQMRVFTLVLHPDTTGMAHIIGMVEDFLGWLKGQGHEVEFCKMKDAAAAFKAQR